MDGFEKLKEKKKTSIRDAAFQLFSEKGVRNVKISDIAKKAGVSQVTIYNHFGSKEALFRDIMIRFTEEQYEKYANLLEKQISFTEKIKHIMLHKIEVVKIIHPEMLEYGLAEDEELVKYYEEVAEKKGLPYFMNLIEEGKKSGEVNPNLSLETILFYINMFDQEVRKQPQLFTGKGKEQFVENLLQLFFYGISGQPRV